MKCMYTIKILHTVPIKSNTNNNKHVICQLHTMQLQKEVKSNPKQPSYKKMCGPKNTGVKKNVKSKIAAKVL